MVNHKLNTKTNKGSTLLLYVLFVLYFFTPICVKFLIDNWGENVFTFIRPLCICTALVASIFLIKNKAIVIALLSIFMITTICELVMINNYAVYMDIDHFMAFATTNLAESTTFAENNLHTLCYIIPMLLLWILMCFLYSKATILPIKNRLLMFVVSVCVTFIAVLPFEKISNRICVQDIKVAMFKNTLKRPPLNIFHLSKIAIKKLYRSKQTKHFEFNSTRSRNIDGKEIYVLAIGESVRYSNCSLNGVYPRKTMPLFEQQNNMIYFHDYYSGGCTTAISVPMIVTRATAEECHLSYQEKSIIKVFQENGFITAIIKGGIFSQISSEYLYQGVDLTIDVISDEQVITAVDSLSKVYDKLFVMFQLQGSHFYYANYPEEFNKWRPNYQHDKEIDSDSLLINSYDNTILYTDYLLNSMIDSLKAQNTISAVWYVSDHGQTITATQGWHGSAKSAEEYHVPLCIWCSDKYINENAEIVGNLKHNVYSPINSDNIFYTICGMTHISLPEQYAHESWDISNVNFRIHNRSIFIGDSVKVVDNK